MISKSDCLSILAGIDDAQANKYIKQIVIEKNIPLDALKFILKIKGIDLANFYEHLRQNHNKKKSPLYINIVKEQTDWTEVRITLSCFVTQALLFSNKLENADKFIKEARLQEVTKALNTYFEKDDMSECLSVIKLLKADLCVMEYLADKRELVNVRG